MRLEPRYLIMAADYTIGNGIEREIRDILFAMNVIVDLCVVPFTGRVSVREEVAHAHRILKATGLPVLLHGYGTNIEGDFDTIMAAIKRIHTELHDGGAARISTTIRLGSRTDKTQTIEDKISAVESQLEAES